MSLTLQWDTPGNRLYETGVDRGVLYLKNAPGVAWSGLTSVAEAPSGGEITGYYIDGVKYLNVASASEFEATINAYYSPKEFDQCDGMSDYKGMTLTDQGRKLFGLSYRSRIGNDEKNSDYGYKIHLVYNALASVTAEEYATIADLDDPITLSWNIKCKPELLVGRRPFAHIILNSLEIEEEHLDYIESILYGDCGIDARLPTPQELFDILDITEFTIDAGTVPEPYPCLRDGGIVPSRQSRVLDGGEEGLTTPDPDDPPSGIAPGPVTFLNGSWTSDSSNPGHRIWGWELPTIGDIPTEYTVLAFKGEYISGNRSDPENYTAAPLYYDRTGTATEFPPLSPISSIVSSRDGLGSFMAEATLTETHRYDDIIIYVFATNATGDGPVSKTVSRSYYTV